MNNVLEYLETAKRKYGNKTALVDLEQSWTFHELWQKARNIGLHMAAVIKPGEAVGVYLDKGCDAIACFLGIVYAGGFYVPLNVKHPIKRITQILTAANCHTVIAKDEHRELLAENCDADIDVVAVDALGEAAEDSPLLEQIRSRSIDLDPLYTMFTSGSTGKPKGVVVSHRAVINFIDQFTDLFHITKHDVIGNQAPYDFDISVKDIYSFLKTGATMYIIPSDYFLQPVKLLDFLCNNHITTIIWAVSAMCIVSGMDGFDYRVPELSKILFSGEIMPGWHLNYWKSHLPQAMTVNLYGPTEITCNCTYHIIKKNLEKDERIPIGRAFPNVRVLLLDKGQNIITEPDVTGEIWVSSASLALGYYGEPELTREVFIQNPHNGFYREIMYRTGDFAQYGQDKQLYFISRKDFQIKHMGHRIELDEIAAQIMIIEEVKRASCIYIEEKERIIAFYEGNIESRKIIQFLKKQVPPYMIPNKCIELKQLPVTERGKTDRRQLISIYESYVR